LKARFATTVEESFSRARENPHRAFLSVATSPKNPGREFADWGLLAQERGSSQLSGVPFSAKDNLAFRGLPMTCASRHLEGYLPPYTSTAVRRMVEAGAILVGKTNLDEFACGSSGETSAFGATANPRDPTRVPGGSSSGAAASVAEGTVPVALGSDTGGSVRCPASFCGVVGFKPTYGRVSRYGLADMAMSLEGPAPIAATVRLCAAAFDALAGPDPLDATTAGAETGRALRAIREFDGDAAGLRIGVVRSFFDGVEPTTAQAVRAAVDRLRAGGARIDEINIENVAAALPAYYVLCYAEFSSAMQKFDGFRYGRGASGASAGESTANARTLFGAEVKRRILLGTFVTTSEHAPRWYARARAIREALAREVENALEGRDAIVGPTMPFRAFSLGSRIRDPLAMYASDVLTVVANLARVPAGSVPIRVPAGTLPVGLQVIGARGGDENVLRVMRAVEATEGVVAEWGPAA
jgi:aspartyl-tRNA(Asn)/glutamyl-tRNA(Gln) amidotransferase subunit A